jgi:WD40 repeat protein
MLLKRFIYLLILIASFVSIVQATGSTCLERFGGTLTKHSTPIESLADTVWMPYSTCFATVVDTQIRIYDIEVPDEFVVLVESEELSLHSVAFSSDGNQIAYNVGGTVYWENTNHSTIITETDFNRVPEITFSLDGESLAVSTANVDGDWGMLINYALQIIDANGDIKNAIPTDILITHLSFHLDNHLLVYGVRPGYIGSASLQYYSVSSLDIMWETEILREILEDNPSDDVPFETESLIYTNIANNGNIVVLSGFYGYHDYDDYYGTLLQVWDVDKPTLLNRVVVSNAGPGDPSRNIARIAISPDSSTVATALHNNRVVLWDWQNGTQMSEFQTDLQQIFGLSFNPTLPDYLMIYGLDADNQYIIQVWNLASVEMVYSLQL